MVYSTWKEYQFRIFQERRKLLDCREIEKVFSEWIDNGHNNFDDENTIILCVELTDGLILSHGMRYEF